MKISYREIMKKVLFIVLFIFILFTISFNTRLTGHFIGDFSIYTKAVCIELAEEDCYYKCWDEVFLNSDGKEVVIQKLENYVCHEKDWSDPRMNYFNKKQ